MDPHITIDSAVCGGEPCIKGTRIPVHEILGHLASGEDYDTVLQNFPNITRDDILACQKYASFLSTEKVVNQ